MVSFSMSDLAFIEYEGTAIFIVLLIIGGRVVYYLLKKEIDRISSDLDKHIEESNKKNEYINYKVDILSKKVDETNSDLTIIKVHVAGIHESVEWIKKYLYKGNK